MDKKVLVEIEQHGEAEVFINVEKKKGYADGYGFRAWGVVGKDKKLYTNSNDITTNYLEVAIVKAMQHLGIEVTDISPSPLNRSIAVSSQR